jgi:hypothetical protein
MDEILSDHIKQAYITKVDRRDGITWETRDG